MPKSIAPGSFDVPGVGKVVANAVPDVFDERDLEYRPRLQPLPTQLDQRDDAKAFFVLKQTGQSCTGHAVAAVTNTVLARNRSLVSGSSPGSQSPINQRVSPYMLYHLARRYDEFPGEDDLGSSLRGAFKGWFYHGVALEEDWPKLDFLPPEGLDDPAFIKKCSSRPLGAYYRVNPYRLDDMQSAIAELHAICVSGVVHDGWLEPQAVQRGDETLYVIARKVNGRSLGGHAFALVGYNEVGFLVQNSWGKKWGKGGFATLPYEDWLDCAYDAWVARPGVPQTPFASGRKAASPATHGALGTAPGPDLQRLAKHVVNLGNDGRLSTDGKFVSTPVQIEGVFQHMERWHDCWLQQRLADRRRIVLYAHGGLVSEAGGLETAQKHLNWWLNNRVYPLSFAWQSGPIETVLDQLADLTRGRLPFGGLGFDLVEQFDRLAEGITRSTLRWMWDQMKQNARAASAPIVSTAVHWPPNGSAAAMARLPGASLTITRLADYLAQHQREAVEVHLVGHSAGAIFHAALLQRLVDAGIPVASLSFMAPAIRVDEFRRDVLPRLGPGQTVSRFATFEMTDRRELDDVCSASGITPYHKSLLYLVSRAFERPRPGDGAEVPLLGMEKFFDRAAAGAQTLRQEIAARGGEAIFAPATSPANSRSDSRSHGGFDDDVPTLTSIVMRILQTQNPADAREYERDSALDAVQCAPPLAGAAPAGAARGELESVPAAAEPLQMAAAVKEPGAARLTSTAEPQTGVPIAPAAEGERVVEVADAPRSGSPVIDLLHDVGWRPVG